MRESLTVGLVLAAGAGSRAGAPKGLLRDPDGTSWVARVAEVLRDGGCGGVVVVVGARGEEVAALVPGFAATVPASGWDQGMAVSLDRGLTEVLSRHPMVDAVLVTLVDTPGVTPGVVARLAAHATPDALARATYDGVEGHPVLLGRHHLDAVAASLRHVPPSGETGGRDAGARDYLARHDVLLVPCEDVGDGRDLDVAPVGTLFPPEPAPASGWRERLRTRRNRM